MAATSDGDGLQVVLPTSRSTSLCATCCGDICAGCPRTRRGAKRACVHHVGCTAASAGRPDRLEGWSDLPAQGKLAAMAAFEAVHGSSLTTSAAGDGVGGGAHAGEAVPNSPNAAAENVNMVEDDDDGAAEIELQFEFGSRKLKCS